MEQLKKSQSQVLELKAKARNAKEETEQDLEDYKKK